MAHLCLCRFAASLRVRCTAGLQNGRLYARAISLRDSCFASRCSQIKTLVSSHHEFRTCSVPAASVVRSTVPVGLPHLTYRAYSTKNDKEDISESTSGSAMYEAFNPKAYVPPIDLLHQSAEVPGMTAARTSGFCKDGQLVEYIYEDVRTFYDGFKRGAKLAGNRNCLGWKPSKKAPYQWMTYNQVLERAEFIGSGIINTGIEPKNTSRIGLFCRNSPEYVITDLACATYSMVLVPLYDTLGPDTCTFIINQANIELVLCDERSRVMKLLRKKTQTPKLKTIVCFHCVSSAVKYLTKKAEISVITFDQLEKLGRENYHTPKPCVPDDLCTICYTSGTTGRPKGAMVTHRNMVAAMASVELLVEAEQLGPDDVYLSYLPLPHIYEKVNQAFLYSLGCQVGFFQGDMLLFRDDIKELRPTLFATVPRLLNRIYSKFMSDVTKSFIKNFVYQLSFKNKMAEIKRGIIRKNSIWDFLVFHKVQNALGGRIRAVMCGSAPLSLEVIDFTRAAFGCIVVEGYGLTETTAVVACQVPGDVEPGNVGTPFPSNIVRLVDIPEMNYFAKNQQGEICVKGANVFVGYLDQPEKMAETVDKDGWMHTGDIGMWLPNGTLKLIDRKKNIFKLSQGEYIAPEKIENVYICSEPVGQMMVYGNSLQATLVGIVVPDPDELCCWVKETLNIDGTSVGQLSELPEVKQAILEELWKVGKKAGLNSFEQVKDILVTTEMFSIENDQMTPTHKIKRENIAAHYEQEITEMYLQLAK